MRIKALLASEESIDNIKPILNIPILLLHECDITKKYTELSDTYRNELKAYHVERAESYFKKQIEKLGKVVHKYSEIKFHIILFPVPKKKEIVKKFISSVEHFKS